MEYQLICTGTLEEIATIVEFLQKDGPVEAPPTEAERPAESAETKGFVPAELMRRALTRQPLTKHTRTMLTAIYECEDNERYLSRRDICSKTGLEPTQLNGVLGRFGQRVKGTDGYDGTSSYFEYRWLEETNEWAYRLPTGLRDVVGEILGRDSFR
ncbi:MAG: hypothetical protein OXF55_10660 [Caldilineaceae bacterium]|nr:hypothetical protein [Caldilineaceae bacterium]